MAERPTSPIGHEPAATPQKVVLIVGSSPLDQWVMRLQMERLGYVVQVVETGQEAVDVVREGREFEFIFLDSQLTDRDPALVTRAIRQWEKVYGGRMVIVVVSPRTIQSDRERWLAAGIDDYINKPVRPSALRDLWNRWSKVPKVLARPWSASPVTAAHAPGLSLLSRSLEALVGDEPELLLEIIGLFLSEFSVCMSQMQQAVDAGDLLTVREVALRLKASSGFLGAHALAGQCDALSRAAGANQRARLTGLYERLIAEGENVTTTLKADGNQLFYRVYH